MEVDLETGDSSSSTQQNIDIENEQTAVLKKIRWRNWRRSFLNSPKMMGVEVEIILTTELVLILIISVIFLILISEIVFIYLLFWCLFVIVTSYCFKNRKLEKEEKTIQNCSIILLVVMSIYTVVGCIGGKFLFSAYINHPDRTTFEKSLAGILTFGFYFSMVLLIFAHIFHVIVLIKTLWYLTFTRSMTRKKILVTIQRSRTTPPVRRVRELKRMNEFYRDRRMKLLERKTMEDAGRRL